MAASVALVYVCSIAGILLLIISVAYFLALKSSLRRSRPFNAVRYFRIGTWNLIDILAVLAYLVLNVVAVYSTSATTRDFGLRAADLSLINMIWLYANPYIDLTTSVLGISLRRTHRWHATIGIVAFVLLLTHLVIFDTSRAPFDLDISRNAGGLVGALSMGASLQSRLLRGLPYESSVRLHQAFAIVSVLAIWCHLSSEPILPRILFYVLSGVFASSSLALAVLILSKNGAFGYGFPRGEVIYRDGAVILKVLLQRPLRLKPGQFVSLWMPSVRVWQCHPFVVTSPGQSLKVLEFLIQPRQGFSRDLMLEADTGRKSDILVLFGGPSGRSVPVGNYDVVLLVASGFGIATQLPYLSVLLHRRKTNNTRNSRVHLIWQLYTPTEAFLVKTLAEELGDPVNTALREKNFTISIYNAHLKRKHEENPSIRAKQVRGTANWGSILRSEVEGEFVEVVRREEPVPLDIIVLVSATQEIKTELHAIRHRYLNRNITLTELDYQPL
ncbi:hypothetical protein NKR23_g12482 [Pleurostoma richardsiae]|uniref:ferric-chelate reductase (NADPH) n=1 Tax=Pleurostoma richardsiae TaxID=41990 RepID=A0AA38VIC2_9PEZI|nr:hypothetical protein NKR23_g12482 [Pleurostoma richardsiae]